MGGVWHPSHGRCHSRWEAQGHCVRVASPRLGQIRRHSAQEEARDDLQVWLPVQGIRRGWLRKVLFVALTTITATYEPQITVLFVLVLVFIFVLANVKFAPFADDELDVIEMLSLLTSFFTLFFG